MSRRLAAVAFLSGVGYVMAVYGYPWLMALLPTVSLRAWCLLTAGAVEVLIGLFLLVGVRSFEFDKSRDFIYRLKTQRADLAAERLKPRKNVQERAI